MGGAGGGGKRIHPLPFTDPALPGDYQPSFYSLGLILAQIFVSVVSVTVTCVHDTFPFGLYF